MTAPAFDTPLHIHHGDCIDYLAGLPGGCIDLVVTDPPYGIAYKTGHRTEPHRFAREIENDRDLSVVEAVVPHLYRLLKDDSACFMFCAWKRQDEVAEILARGGVHGEEPHRLGQGDHDRRRPEGRVRLPVRGAHVRDQGRAGHTREEVA